MKKYVLPACVLCLGFTLSVAHTAENLPRKLNAAETVIANLNPQEALLRGMPNAQSNPMLAQAISKMNFKKINNHILNMMMAVFSEQELVALANFQETPEGKSIQQKMPRFQQFIGVHMQEKLAEALQNTVGISEQGILKQNPYQMR